MLFIPILILHKISTYMTKLEPHYHGQVGFNFFPALDKQILNYTVSLLVTNQSSTVIL